MGCARWFAVAGTAVAVAFSAAAEAGPYTAEYVFGDSLSDSGNNATALGPGARTSVPISGNTFIPDFPYASGHYTNDRVWAQSFAQALNLPLAPSLLGGGNFASSRHKHK